MVIDLVLLVVFVTVVGFGFWSGMIRTAIAMVAFYASLILASLYFKFVSVFVARRGVSDVAADVLSFVVVLALAFVVLFALSVYTFRYVRVPGQFEFVDRLIGAGLGMLLGIAVLTVVAMLLQFALITEQAGGDSGVAGLIRRGMQASALVPLLLGNLLPRLYLAVGPFIPDAALPLFRPTT